MATTTTPSKSSPFPTPKTIIRTGRGQSPPRPRKAPVFSTYSSRTVSARNDRLDASESVVAATCLVTRSQPIVAPTAMSRTSRRPIRVIVRLLDAAETPAGYVVALLREYRGIAWRTAGSYGATQASEVEEEGQSSALLKPAATETYAYERAPVVRRKKRNGRV